MTRAAATAPVWLDLLTEDDPHPRRFDGPASLRPYLLRVERLSEEAADTLLEVGMVEPPLARHVYRLRRLRPPSP
ncbi:hypothetical protein ACFSR9_05595 [Deinococcus taklimakanensis]|uniref:Uncharacterized protein n=1 Tax=Deinococcus taklimakanensis TaxID=536443 RepID=A0ABW5P0X7_9DEIO